MHDSGLLKCLMNVAHYETVVTHVNGALAERPEWFNSLNEYRLQAAWRLGMSSRALRAYGRL